MASFTKARIVADLQTTSGMSKRDASEAVGTLFDVIKELLADGKTVKLSDFGTFSVRDKKARPGRNPQTGQPIRISARRVVQFKVSDGLKKALNGPR